MFEQLFGSKTRVKLLQLFYTNPNRSFYVREITRKIDEQINSVRRELANLLSIGIITSDANNNRLYYEVNQKYKHYRPLAAIFGGAAFNDKPAKEAKAGKAEKPSEVEAAEPKPVVVSEHPMAKDLRSTGHVELAIFTGQFTRDDTAGIDVLIVGDVNPTKVAQFIAELEAAENKELRYTVVSMDNYNYRLQINDRFINNLLTAKKQVIINDNDLKVN